jgi:squalene-hopene/tetraprenyl-beta-curcumene cyclase
MGDAPNLGIDTPDDAPEVGEISRIRTKVASVDPNSATRAFMHEDSAAVAAVSGDIRTARRNTLTPLFTFALPPRRRSQRPGAPHLPKGPDVEQSRIRAVQFLLDHMLPGEDGNGLMFHSPMQGRVLETALTLHVLQKHGLDFDWQDKLRTFLFENLPRADLFSSTIAHPVLLASRRSGARLDDPAYSSGVHRLLSGLQFARKRKQALLGTILAEIGAVPFEAVALHPDQFAGEAVHRFSQMYHAALKIIHERRAPRGEDVSADIVFLEETQARDGSWEQQSLITLVALFALGPENRAFEEGLGFLKRLTRDDGGVAFCDNLNLWTTALGAIALLNSQQIPPRTLHGVADYMIAHQQPSGGWAFREHVEQTDTDTTAQCAQFLLQFDAERYAASIDRAHEHFLSRQRPDGGYPTYEIAGESEATMTANIVLVQAISIERHPKLLEPIRRGLQFICSRQATDGTFERSWSLSENYSIFRINLAFNGCRGIIETPEIEAAQRLSGEYLMASQHADGGWGQISSKPSDALSTSYALLTLALLRRQVPPKHFAHGLDFLISQQSSVTGEIESIPDVVGPRPIVFDIPLLSTIFGAMAMRVLEQM